MFRGFIGGGASYLKLVGIDADGARYEMYELSDVVIREEFAEDECGVRKGGAVLYYITKKSGCRTAYGEKYRLPRPKSGDLLILHAGTDEEITYRVAEAGYFVGTGTIEYTRIKLC